MCPVTQSYATRGETIQFASNGRRKIIILISQNVAELIDVFDGKETKSSQNSDFQNF